MLLKVYSLSILTLDLIVLFFKICFEIFIALYRTLKPVPLKSLHKEVVMVVGAGRGIGKELALRLSKLGAKVACVDADIASCNVTVATAVGVAKSYYCSIIDEEEVAQTVNKIQHELGNITMLFHCCGIPSPRSLLEDQPDVREIIDVTVLSHFWLSNKVLPQMKQAGRGHIVLLSSVAGLSVAARGGSRVTTATAQFAVQGFAESLRTELRHSHNQNIAVTLVHIYPFIIGIEAASDIRFRIPSFFGTIPAKEAAKKILEGVRRNYEEFSIPVYLLYLRHICRILPKKASFMLRELLDTGVDFV
ncbi:epidermal retinol dehydrogenase 2 isoform X2 [Halictus rubicundus]